MASRELVKLYFDYKSPFAYLAMAPAFALPERFADRAALDSVPAAHQGQGRSQRLLRVEGPVLVSRRAPRRERAGRLHDPRAPQGLRFDTGADRRPLRAARRLLPGLQRGGLLPLLRAPSGDRRAGGGQPADRGAGGSGAEFLGFLAADGARAFESCLAEGERDHIFGVPIFVFRDEPFWGQDRIPLLEQRLREAGLAR